MLCALEPVCSFLGSVSAVVSGNGSGCQSQADIEHACGTLPVKLVSFTATSESNTTLVAWLTAEERNSAVFEIEHSVTGRAWQKVGETAARGESNDPASYQWIHRNPAGGMEFKIGLLSAGIVYPNPVCDKIHIDSNREIVSLKIVDLQGRTVYETSRLSRDGISVDRIAAGAYQIQMITKTGTVHTDRIIIF